MTYRKIDTSKVKPEMDFEQIQKDLEKFKNHTSMPQDDVKKLMNYVGKFERLIADENYQELEYSAECFMCNLRDILANLKREPRKEAIVKCADSMGITVQKTNGVLEVTLPMILPTKKKAKSEYLFEPLLFAMDKASKEENEERLEKLREKNRGEKTDKTDKEERVPEDEDIEIVSANSIEELIKKVQDVTYASMSDNVMTEAELAVGGHIDFKG